MAEPTRLSLSSHMQAGRFYRVGGRASTEALARLGWATLSGIGRANDSLDRPGVVSSFLGGAVGLGRLIGTPGLTTSLPPAPIDRRSTYGAWSFSALFWSPDDDMPVSGLAAAAPGVLWDVAEYDPDEVPTLVDATGALGGAVDQAADAASGITRDLQEQAKAALDALQARLNALGTAGGIALAIPAIVTLVGIVLVGGIFVYWISKGAPGGAGIAVGT